MKILRIYEKRGDMEYGIAEGIGTVMRYENQEWKVNRPLSTGYQLKWQGKN